MFILQIKTALVGWGLCKSGHTLSMAMAFPMMSVISSGVLRHRVFVNCRDRVDVDSAVVVYG